MNLVLKDIRRNPLLWLLVFVPVLFIAVKLRPGSHTMLFILSVLAIVPLAALLSHATESVAAKTGDAVGGLLNATLGNLTELVIALAALRAGDYALVKASIAGAIVANTLFMLGASLLIGGLKHHTQEFNRTGARLQDSLLFLATIALLDTIPRRNGRHRRRRHVRPEAKPLARISSHRRVRPRPAVLARHASGVLQERRPWRDRRGRRGALAHGAGTRNARRP